MLPPRWPERGEGTERNGGVKKSGIKPMTGGFHVSMSYWWGLENEISVGAAPTMAGEGRRN
jgi:hypothetical protein